MIGIPIITIKTAPTKPRSDPSNDLFNHLTSSLGMTLTEDGFGRLAIPNDRGTVVALRLDREPLTDQLLGKICLFGGPHLQNLVDRMKRGTVSSSGKTYGRDDVLSEITPDKFQAFASYQSSPSAVMSLAIRTRAHGINQCYCGSPIHDWTASR